MSRPQKKPRMAGDEYLALERGALEKSEYLQGECSVRANASRWHNMLAGRLVAALLAHLDSTPCYPYMAGRRLHIARHEHYVYLDVMVVCGEEAYAEEDMVNDATVIVEVLSPTTESYDRGRKFLHYQSLTSFKEYVLVSQDAMRVEVFHRKDQTEWVYQVLTQPTDVLRLDTIQFLWTLEGLYQSVPLLDAESEETV